MSKTLLVIITSLLFLIELLYIKIAERYKILDQPNQRSSHTVLTVTGGGIIFMIAMTCYPLFFSFNFYYFLAGLLFAGIISFLDDMRPIHYKTRIICHFLVVGLLFYQLELFDLPGYLILAGLIITVGIINAINFMDGINGMTGSYALITLASLLYINEYVEKQFVPTSLLLTAILATLVFIFFNFRTKARCFAGDVGSITKGFILLFFIGKLIIISAHPAYIFLLFIYGLDTITTLLFRLLRKENIFLAHRTFYFQYLVHEKKLPHLFVSSIYACAQLVFNILLISSLIYSTFATIISAIVITYLFILLRFWMEGKKRLLNTQYEAIKDNITQHKLKDSYSSSFK